MLRKLTLAALVAALTPLAFLGNSAEAAPVLVTSRAALGGTDFIDWADLGPTETLVANSFTIASDDGRDVTVSKPSGDFKRLDQGDPWHGDFAPGDALLFTWRDVEGPISIDFGGLVFGGGAHIQNNVLGPFTAKIEAFDAANVSLGSFTVDGIAGTGENSAIFIGILDSVQSIARIEIMTEAEFGHTFAINRFDFVTTRQPTPAPEPGTLALLGAGLVGLAVLRRRKST